MSAPAPQVLRQSEVDALLGLGPEVTGSGAAVPYDITRPERLAGARRVALESALGRFADALRDLFTARVRVAADFRLEGIEICGVADARLVLAEPCAALAFPLDASGTGFGWVDFGAPLALATVERLLGGAGEDPPAIRTLTTLEQRVLRPIADEVLERLRGAFPAALPSHAAGARLVTQPTLLPSGAGNDEQLLARFAATLAGRREDLTVVLPWAAVDAALALETARREEAAAPGTLRFADLGAARVTLTVRTPRRRLKARALASLAPGAVLALPQGSDEPFEVTVHGRPRFLATLGEVRGQLAFRVIAARETASGAIPGRTPEV